MNKVGSDLKSWILSCASGKDIGTFCDALSTPAAEALVWDWTVWARTEQLPPSSDWTTWLILGGRGAGKTRAGAEWVRGMAMGRPPFASAPHGRIALVGETYGDAREVMVEGVSGIMSVCPRWERPIWQPSRRRLEWQNGAVAQVFSATDPESLRGPQFDAAWSDEVAKWPDADAAWDMLQFALRLGRRPRQVATTTPRAVPLVRRMLADPMTTVTKMATAENAAHLAPEFMSAVVGRYAGTRLGRQELMGELVEDREDALWERKRLDADRVAKAPPLARVVVAVDPPATSGPSADACGIVAAGLGEDGRAYVVADATVGGAAPHVWASRAVELFHTLEANELVVEGNQGGEMTEAVLRQVDPQVPLKRVHARRGKYVRAEPVALLYEQGRVRHVGTHAALEDQMCNFAPSGLSGGRSPDRIDAMVWAVTELMLRAEGQPRMRKL